jgi:cysteine desulfurase family protein
MSRIYLDNAATSWPKPESVYSAVDQTQREIGVSVARGGYSSSVAAGKIVNRTRQSISELIGADDPRRIAFTGGCTDSLSTAIFGFLNQGDHAIATVVDHNSVVRPLLHLRDTGVIDLTIVGCDDEGLVQVEAIADAITPKTALVAVTHASNVLGTIQPVEQIGEICAANNVAFLLDAAQTMGHLPVDLKTINCQFLACAGHKGLLGPLGTGILNVCESVADRLRPLRFGGTGSERVDQGQPKTMPAMLEAGSINVPAIAGLHAGIAFIGSEEGRAGIQRSKQLATETCIALSKISGVRVFGPGADVPRMPVIAFSVDGYDSATIAGILDSSFEIQTRSGFHCAPLLHQSLGTEVDGLVRISMGHFNTAEEINNAVAAVREIAAG